MRTVFRGAFFLFFVALLANCKYLKKGGDEGDASVEASAEPTAAADAAAATPTAPPAPLASNEDDVVRFPDETALANVVAPIQRPHNVREAPITGKVVAGVVKGQSMTQIAKREAYVLVTFDSGGSKLMGWVHRDAFSLTVSDAGIAVPKCAAGETPLFSDGPFCGHVCTKDAECPAPTACKGASNKWANGRPGALVKVCTVFHPHDAGAPTPAPVADAGATPVDAGAAPVDAGAAPTADAGTVTPKSDGGLLGLLTAKDAGGLLPPGPAADVVAPPCPIGFLLVTKDNKCHRVCTGNLAACKNTATQRCIKCQGLSVCAATNNDCQ